MRLLLVFFFVGFSQIAVAQFSVAKIFSSNMVLQRDVEIPIWGWGVTGTKVTINYHQASLSTTVKDGTWEILLPKKAQGTDYQIDINTPDTSISFTNIAIGDVWLCAGQSNMEWTVENSNDAAHEISHATYPKIRLFEVPHKITNKPVRDIEEGQWEICDSNSVKQFSAVGYFFGRQIYKEVKVPIGLLSDNFGGTVVETWMSPNGFSGLPHFQKEVNKLANTDLDKIKKEGKTKFDKWILNFAAKDKGKKGALFVWQNTNAENWEQMPLPSTWESNGINNFKNLDGVVWFQKTIQLTQEEATKQALLSLGTIDDTDITWINGIQVGEMHNRYNKDRNYKIKKGVLKAGVNTIVIRVEDYIGGGGLYGAPDKLHLKLGNQKISLAGKWKYKLGYAATTKMPMGAKFGPNSFPTLLYNGMIAPIQKFPIRGVIWYQGESNAYRAEEYKSLFVNWIRDWRKLWKNEKMPMIWVQLANFQQPQPTPEESEWAELREAQTFALSEPNTAMITAIDIGSAHTIHPLNKQTVGERLANAALSISYDMPQNYQSPTYQNHKKKKKYIDITFNSTGKGLQAKSKYGYVKGFTIAGKDKKFHWAQAEILSDNKIRVFAPKGIRPVAVRYAWANNPDPANVYNAWNLPLLPFRTDRWKLSTVGIIRK